jgi:multiple sugar transport system permease protein
MSWQGSEMNLDCPKNEGIGLNLTPKKNKPGSLAAMKKHMNSYLFLAPFMIFFTLFTVIPVLVSILLGVTNFNMVTIPSFVGLSNYIRMLLDDDVFFIAVKNTIIFAFITGPVSYIISILFAWLVNEVNRKLRILFTALFYIPSLTVNAIMIWTYIFSGDAYGLVNSLLMKLGILNDPINWLVDARYNMTIVIIIQLWLSLGVGFLSFIAGFQTIDRSIYEAGAIDGIQNRFQELWYLTLPSMRPQLMFGAVMQIGASFSVSQIPMTLTGAVSTDYSTTTIVTHIIDVGTTRMEMGYACAIATVLFIMMVIMKNAIQSVIQSD